MNEALNRFGFTEDMAHRRVPGPYVPLQDEPADVGSIKADRNTKTVLVPQIQSMFMDSVEMVQNFLTSTGCKPLKPKAT